MKLSVSSYSYNQYLSEGKLTQLDTVRLAAQMGFDGIEFTELAPHTLSEQCAYARQIRNAAREYGIEIVAYAVGASLYRGSTEADAKETERLCGQLEVAAELGAPIMRHDICYSEKVGERTVGFSRMLETIADNARAVAERASSLGIRTCTENHGYVAQDSDRLEALFAAVAHESFGLLVDIGNFACVDEDSASAVSRLAPYAIHVHAKDFRKYAYGAPIPSGEKAFATRGKNHLCGCVIGEGDIPVEQCLAILSGTGYDGYITVEYEGAEDCMAGIARGKANIGRMLEGMKK